MNWLENAYLVKAVKTSGDGGPYDMIIPENFILVRQRSVG